MLYCNENHQLILLSNVDNTSLSKPQLTIPVLSPTISMSSLKTISTSNSNLSFSLKNVIKSKKNSLYTPKTYDDIFDRIDLSDFNDISSTNNSISSSSSSSSSSSCLKIYYKIDNNDHPLYQKEIPPLNQIINNNQILTKKSSFSFKNFKNLIRKNNNPNIKQLLIKIKNNELIIKESKQLKTFKIILKPIEIFEDSKNLPTLILNKQRESRLNSSFLKIFAIHKSIQLNININIEFYYNKFINSNCYSIDEFFSKFNIENPKLKLILKFNFLSKDKLNSIVILPPRKDLFKHNYQINKLNYFKNNLNNLIIKNGSIIRNNCKQFPWYNFKNLNLNSISNSISISNSNFKKIYSPIGFLSNNTQYTVKNWENKRWSSL